jgi:2-polyprenyl-3-methyl-5-hydroxy-6-metoxy-1,4-benzoquinol methylase
VTVETGRQRSKRLYQRTLFDSVARLYQDSRPGYPSHMVEFVVDTVGPASMVLEIGCGTGQLTERLARFGFGVTAIDIGSSLIAAARSHVQDPAVSFQVSSFEDLEADDASFDLIISAAAFHWVDPEVRFVKSARLLRPGGWLALLDMDERYDDPFGAALAGMWAARSDTGGAWVKRAPDAEVMAATGLFGKPVCRTDTRRATRPADVVIGVENTRATTLSWPEDERLRFSQEMLDCLGAATEVHLTSRTVVTMAPVLAAERR